MLRCVNWMLAALAALGVNLAHAGSYDDFFFAVRQDNAPVVRSLLERGFDPNTEDPSGQTGIFLALKSRSEKVALVLVSVAQIDLDKRNAQDETPLMLAALRGYIDVCRALVKRDADVNKPGWAPLHYAASGGHLEVIRLLLDNHAYIDAESPNGSTPLMMAAMYGSVEAVQLLAEYGADLGIKNELGLTALDFARRGGKPDSATLLESLSRSARTGGTW